MLSKKAKELLSRESKTKRSLKFELGGSPTVDINPTFNPQNTVQQPQGDWQDYTGALGKIGFGVKSFVEGIQERGKAKTYQRVSEQENDRRLENQRQTGYVLTPYTNKRT